jgi:KDO2-lipid IV(A) lauroyltransferase
MWCFWLWMRVTAALPLEWALLIHRAIGRLIYRLAAKQRRTVRRNLEICFPEQTARELDSLAKRHIESLAISFAECAVAWFTPARRLEDRFRIVGLEHLENALQRGRGVLLYTGHFTTLEICGRPLKQIMPRVEAMFSHRSNALLDAIQRRGRLQSMHALFSSDDVRSLLRSLKRNAVIWYAPDQAHTGPNAALLPFFHELAMTNIATSKLARVSGAAVVPFSYRRLEGEARYELRFYPELTDFPSDDSIADTRRLVQWLEEFIRLCPDQYVWSHRRFKGRPQDLADLYCAKKEC